MLMRHKLSSIKLIWLRYNHTKGNSNQKYKILPDLGTMLISTIGNRLDFLLIPLIIIVTGVTHYKTHLQKKVSFRQVLTTFHTK